MATLEEMGKTLFKGKHVPSEEFIARDGVDYHNLGTRKLCPQSYEGPCGSGSRLVAL